MSFEHSTGDYDHRLPGTDNMPVVDSMRIPFTSGGFAEAPREGDLPAPDLLPTHSVNIPTDRDHPYSTLTRIDTVKQQELYARVAHLNDESGMQPEAVDHYFAAVGIVPACNTIVIRSTHYGHWRAF